MYNCVQKPNSVLSSTNQRCSPSFTRQLFQLHFLSIPAFGNTLLTETNASHKLLGILTLCISDQKRTEKHFRVTGFYIAEGKA